MQDELKRLKEQEQDKRDEIDTVQRYRAAREAADQAARERDAFKERVQRRRMGNAPSREERARYESLKQREAREKTRVGQFTAAMADMKARVQWKKACTGRKRGW